MQRRFFSPPSWIAIYVAAILLLFFLLQKLRLVFGENRKLCTAGAVIFVLVVLSYVAGCSGFVSSTPPRSSSGTPAGTYTVIVTGQSGVLSHDVKLTLSVK